MADRSTDATTIQKGRACGDRSHWTQVTPIPMQCGYRCQIRLRVCMNWVYVREESTGVQLDGQRTSSRKDALFVRYFHQDPNHFRINPGSITSRSSLITGAICQLGRGTGGRRRCSGPSKCRMLLGRYDGTWPYPVPVSPPILLCDFRLIRRRMSVNRRKSSC